MARLPNINHSFWFRHNISPQRGQRNPAYIDISVACFPNIGDSYPAHTGQMLLTKGPRTIQLLSDSPVSDSLPVMWPWSPSGRAVGSEVLRESHSSVPAVDIVSRRTESCPCVFYFLYNFYNFIVFIIKNCKAVQHFYLILTNTLSFIFLVHKWQ